MRWTKGKHAFIVATHIDKAHIHNHIIYNSTSVDCSRKFNNFFLSGLAVQKLSDRVFAEHGLSIITPKPYRERQKRTVFPKKRTQRDKLMLHKAAKQAFDQLDGKKVPSRQVLHEEFNRLLIEKKQAYAEYRQVKKEMQEYLIAKQTVETILNIDRKQEQEKKPVR